MTVDNLAQNVNKNFQLVHESFEYKRIFSKSRKKIIMY